MESGYVVTKREDEKTKEKMMTDQMNNMEMEEMNTEHENELSFDQQVLEKIANYAIRDVDGILELKGDFGSSIKSFFGKEDQTKGVSAEVGKKEVALDLQVIAEYGKDIPAAFQKAIDKISSDVALMTNLKVVELNMHVNDIMTREEYDRKEQEKKNKENEKRRRDNARFNDYQDQYEAGAEPISSQPGPRVK